MRTRRRGRPPGGARVAVLGVLAAALLGCGPAGASRDPAAGPAPTPGPPGATGSVPSSPASGGTFRGIGPEVRAAYFPRSDAVEATDAPVLTTHRGQLEVADRQLPGCDPHQQPGLEADGRVEDFAWDTRVVGAYVVARQLTVYADPATAAASVVDLQDQPPGCRALQGRRVLSESRSRFASYPDLRLAGTRDRPVLREVTVLTARGAEKAVDLVTRRSNAVLLTRVVAEPVIGNYGNGYAQASDAFLSSPEGHPGVIGVVRRAAVTSTRILDRLR